MRIIVRIFAAIGFLVVSSILTGVIIGVWFSSSIESVTLPGRMVLSFDFSRPVVENVATDPFSIALGDNRVALRTVISAIDRARRDDRVAGLTANVSDTSLEPAQVEEVRAALKRFNDSGKFTLAFADSFGDGGPSSRAYWLASAFDEIWLQPLGQVNLSGPALTLPFARAALDRLGIVPDLYERYEYKGAADSLTLKDISAPLRENYTKLLNDMKIRIVDDIAAARELKPREVNALIDRAPILDSEALKAKLVDHLGYLDQFRAAAAEKGGEDAEEFDLISYYFGASSGVKAEGGVALIYVDGPIVRLDDESGPFGETGTVSAETLVDALNQATEANSIKAILLRINSPGGSVTASESIRRAIQQARDAGKYVVVSMGGTAASGGYWIATAADKIVADPTTITGSIGVVAGKIVFGPLSERLGVHWTELTTSANGGMWSATRTFTAPEKQRMNAMLDNIYNAFVQRVSEGRNIPADKLDALARGRVWSGASAKKVGLVDELGDMRTGLNLIRAHLGMAEDQPLSITLLPRPMSRLEQGLALLRYYMALPGMQPLGFDKLMHALQARLGLSPSGNLYFAGPPVE